MKDVTLEGTTCCFWLCLLLTAARSKDYKSCAKGTGGLSPEEKASNLRAYSHNSLASNDWSS
jgi:hypothetical protein